MTRKKTGLTRSEAQDLRRRREATERRRTAHKGPLSPERVITLEAGFEGGSEHGQRPLLGLDAKPRWVSTYGNIYRLLPELSDE